MVNQAFEVFGALGGSNGQWLELHDASYPFRLADSYPVLLKFIQWQRRISQTNQGVGLK